MGLLELLQKLIFGKDPLARAATGTGTTGVASTRPPPPPASELGEPFTRSITIRFVNSEGVKRIFTADAGSLRDKGRFVSVVVQPRRVRIALARERIENLDEVERALAALPDPAEAKILAFHNRRGSSSPRYEQLRRQYADFHYQQE